MPFTVAVCGGGIGGLALAIGLDRQGIDYHIYEAASAFAEIGAGVSFGPNSVRAMSLISPKIKAGYDRKATSNRDEYKANTWFDFQYGMKSKHGDPAGKHITSVLSPPIGQSSVHRAHFLDELVSLIPDERATFGKKVDNIVELANGEGVRIYFADGSTATASIAIGTDGIKSNIRPMVVGKDHPAAKATFSGKYAYRGLIPMDKAVGLLGDERARNAQMYLGQDGHILTFPIEKGNTMNVVAFRTEPSGKWENEQWVLPMDRSKMEADFSDWGDDPKSILSLMEKPDLWALFEHPPAPSYYKGRICLSGDSAHASTPHQGAGAGMALEDAYILSNVLGRVKVGSDDEIAAAFEAYNATRKERSQKLVTTSHQVAEIYEFQRAGDSVEEIEAALRDWYKWIWEHDLEKDLQEAFRTMDNRLGESQSGKCSL
jgi:salicylate hydroxylase